MGHAPRTTRLHRFHRRYTRQLALHHNDAPPLAEGVTGVHHIYPNSGWTSYYVREEGDVATALGLLERGYRLAREKQGRNNRGQPALDFHGEGLKPSK